MNDRRRFDSEAFFLRQRREIMQQLEAERALGRVDAAAIDRVARRRRIVRWSLIGAAASFLIAAALFTPVRVPPRANSVALLDWPLPLEPRAEGGALEMFGDWSGEVADSNDPLDEIDNPLLPPTSFDDDPGAELNVAATD